MIFRALHIEIGYPVERLHHEYITIGHGNCHFGSMKQLLHITSRLTSNFLADGVRMITLIRIAHVSHTGPAGPKPTINRWLRRGTLAEAVKSALQAGADHRSTLPNVECFAKRGFGRVPSLYQNLVSGQEISHDCPQTGRLGKQVHGDLLAKVHSQLPNRSKPTPLANARVQREPRTIP